MIPPCKKNWVYTINQKQNSEKILVLKTRIFFRVATWKSPNCFSGCRLKASLSNLYTVAAVVQFIFAKAPRGFTAKKEEPFVRPRLGTRRAAQWVDMFMNQNVHLQINEIIIIQLLI